MKSKQKDELERVPSLSNTEAVILELLAEQDELYGLEMIGKRPALLKRGTIYVTLDRLEDKGFVASREVPPPAGSRGPNRRIYRIVGAGSRALEARQMIAAALHGSFAKGVG